MGLSSTAPYQPRLWKQVIKGLIIFICFIVIVSFWLACQRQGRSDTFATEFDLEAEEYVPLPKGDVHKKKEIVQDVTLHDLDVANARPQVRQGIPSE